MYTALIKKKIKFSSYIRKFRMEQLQSHLWLTASSYMGKYLRISSYIRKPFLIYDFATAPFWISLYMRKIFIFFFISVETQSVMLVLYFRPSFVNCWSSYLRSGSSLPTPFPVSTNSIYSWDLLETIFCRSLTLCIRPHSEPTKLLDHPQTPPWRGGGLRQITTCLKVPV